MPRYYVNKNAQTNDNYENEVHRTDELNCLRPAAQHNRVDLGLHDTCHTAVTKAKNLGYKANGCYYCANACHTG